MIDKVLLYMLLYILWESVTYLPGHSIIYMILAPGRHVIWLFLIGGTCWNGIPQALSMSILYFLWQRMHSYRLSARAACLNDKKSCGYALRSSGSIFLQDFLELLWFDLQSEENETWWYCLDDCCAVMYMTTKMTSNLALTMISSSYMQNPLHYDEEKVESSSCRLLLESLSIDLLLFPLRSVSYHLYPQYS